jgi:Bifunctional DNA primase/polymerase, N-terminal
MRVLPVHGIVSPGATEADARCGCGSRACTSPGKHPVFNGWQELATADNVKIRQWLGNGHRRNYGIRLGGSWSVVEVDEYDGGSFRALREVAGTLGPVSVSGRGHHVFFRSSNVPNGTRLGPGMTVRSDGYYVVGPGSTHYTGHRYGRRRYGFDRMHERPDLTVGTLDVAKTTSTKVPRVLPKTIHDGEGRWRALLSLAGGLVSRGIAEDAVLEQVQAFNRTHCVPPKDEQEVARLVRWVVENDGRTDLPDPEPRTAKDSGVTLADVHEVFREGLHLPDPTVVDVTAATVVANIRDGADPVFLVPVGAASRGKTEAIDSTRGVPEVYALSELSAATLLSGYRDAKDRGKDQSLLTRLSKQGKRLMMLKDFGTVLSMHRDARAQVLSQLREVFDGSLVKPTGMGVELSWEGHMGFIAGATPAIDEHHGAMSILGDRFIYYRVPDVDRTETTTMALGRRADARALRVERREVMAELIAGIDPAPAPTLSANAIARLVAVSDFATRARTAVSRDGYNREVLNLPELEAPMRLAKQMAAVFDALKDLGYAEDRALAVVEKMAWDSIPPIRVRCLEALQLHGRLKTPIVAERTGIPTNTARRALEDLALVGILEREKVGEADSSPNWWEVTIDVPERSNPLPETSGG